MKRTLPSCLLTSKPVLWHVPENMSYSGLNEKGPHRLLCLNTQLVERLGRLGGVSLGVNFEVSETYASPCQLSLGLVLVDEI